MEKPQVNIYRSLAMMFLPGDLLNYFEVVSFKEEFTGKEVMNGYPEKILHIVVNEQFYE